MQELGFDDTTTARPAEAKVISLGVESHAIAFYDALAALYAKS